MASSKSTTPILSKEAELFSVVPEESESGNRKRKIEVVDESVRPLEPFEEMIAETKTQKWSLAYGKIHRHRDGSASISDLTGRVCLLL